MLTERTLQQWLGGASTYLIFYKPVHGPSFPRQSGSLPPPIQDIQNCRPFGGTWRRGPPPPGPGPGGSGTFLQAMLVLPVLGRGDELPFFALPTLWLDLRFPFTF